MRRAWAVGVSLGLAIAGCHAARSGAPDLAPPSPSPSPSPTPSPSPLSKVDILFVFEDSPGTADTRVLPQYFPALTSGLAQLAASGHPASYHIGIVTTDLGAGLSKTGNCTPGGLGARLQALGRARASSCMPPTGGNFIALDQATNTSNLPPGQDLPTTFTCMASVGSVGCGFEMPLESAYRALSQCMPDENGDYPDCAISENRGFLRPDSLVVVFFVLDEDDCSADPQTDLFDFDSTQYGPWLSYRCTNYGIVCQQGVPLKERLMPYGDSDGPLPGCQSAPNPTGNYLGPPPPGQGKLTDVNRYIQFFTQPNGLRKDPNDVILAAIAAPPSPVASILGNPGNYQPCPAGSPIDGMHCAALLQHSCFAPPPLDTTFFGDPAVRVAQVVSSARQNQFTSMCVGDYTQAMTSLAALIAARVAP